MGNDSAATQAWSNALNSLPSGMIERPPEMDEHALVLERLGRVGEARAIRGRLAAIGYRSVI